MVYFLAEYCGGESSDTCKEKKISERQDSNSGM